MTWTKLSDKFLNDTALLSCSRSARLLYVELYVYGNLIEGDGRVPVHLLPRFTDSDDPHADLDELAAVHPHVTLEGDTVVLDWKDQEKSDVLEKRRERRVRIQRDYRARQEAHRVGEHHETCRPGTCHAVTGNKTGNETGQKTAPRPASAPPQEGQEEGGRAAPATAGLRPPKAIEPHRFDAGGDDALSCEDCGLPEAHPTHRRAIA